MLSQIPKVSMILATKVIENYKTIYNLTDKLREDKTCLNNLTYTTKNGKERKFNKSSIENIIGYLL
jgi:hypothetical protein